MRKLFPLLFFLGILQASTEKNKGVDELINDFFAPISSLANDIVFFPIFVINGISIPFVLVILVVAAVYFTFYFQFLNLRAINLAIKTVKGKYSSSSDPGEITHFQALSTALSATVGLGNIAGVAVAIGAGGPGATIWMILLGFLGMSSKFCECTLAVKYRTITADNKVIGGGMQYLKRGFAEKGMKTFGMILAVIFAIGTIGGSIGAGNMFQANQAHSQISETFGILEQGWQFGLILSLLVGAVIIGGIKSIARFTAILVPFMCIIYVLAAIAVLVVNSQALPSAFQTIFQSAFSTSAVGGGIAGGMITVILQGVKRGVFSNEAGVGSAGIAHAAVKTTKPASEGVVALLEPFIDTVIVCTLTALVIVSTGVWEVKGELAPQSSFYKDNASTQVLSTTDRTLLLTEISPSVNGRSEVTIKGASADATAQTAWVQTSEIKVRSGWSGGIWVTSKGFETVISWFPYVLSIAVLLFAFSTMISWSYYGERALAFLTNSNGIATIIYRLSFCFFIIVGSSISLANVINLSDALFFTMVFPNLIGLFILLPVIKSELQKFLDHVAKIEKAD